MRLHQIKHPIEIITKNSTYHIVPMGEGHFQVQGGSYFLEKKVVEILDIPLKTGVHLVMQHPDKDAILKTSKIRKICL